MKQILIIIITGFVLMSCSDYKAEKTTEKIEINKSDMDTITLGAGCFWCVEAIFQDIKGVESVVSGYSNGTIKNPAYKEVCTGRTGHAEVCQVVYDPEIVSLAKILEVFWQVHDPTTLNRQGADVGTQYRSGIYYHNDSQKKVALSILNKLNANKVFENPIVTEIEEIKMFYPAEENHQDYYSSNGDQPYCRAVISPKIEKFKKSFAEILK
jgi:peptide-methionine (S)-S-oxide reductase